MGMSRYLGWRRRGLSTFLGASVLAIGTWYTMVSREKDRVFEVSKRFQAAIREAEANGARMGRSGGASAAAMAPGADAEVLSKLFPPAPQFGMPPTGLSAG